MTKINNQQNLYAKTTKESAKTNNYTEIANTLKQHNGVVVGVFWDQNFKGMEIPKGLQFDDFMDTWGSIPNVLVVPLDVNQVRSYSILFKSKMDILVFPYGSVFPMDAMHLYTAQTFNHFLKRGGAVLTTGGIPFMKQAGPDGEICDISTPEKMTEVYDKWVSKFGVKYYETRIPAQKQLVNNDLLPSLPRVMESIRNQYGISINNSAREPVPKPPHGNVFPERYPAREVTPLMKGLDLYGKEISTSAVYIQDFIDGSRRIHFTHEADPHPLTPTSAYFKPLMQDLFYLLTNKIMISDFETEYACYREEEEVRIRTCITSHDTKTVEITLLVEVVADGKVVHQEHQSMEIHPGEQWVDFCWRPINGTTDEYTILAKIECNERIVSKTENAFVIWKKDVSFQSDDVGIKNEYFTVGNKGTFITGTNYYESTRGEIMWFRPNVQNIVRDFRLMHECGVNMIRPHYHHLKWFKDYLLYHHDTLFRFYDTLKDVDSPYPDERGWRIWDLFIYLCNKYNIIYNGDLFTLIPEEMGDPRGWFGTVEAVYDNEKRKIQKEFLRQLEGRYKEFPGISWDLFNEPYKIPDSDVDAWANDLKQVIREINDKRLVTVGGPFELGKSVDYDCPHGRISEDFVNTREHPVLLQELHIDNPEPLACELEQAETLRRIFVSSLRSGVAGICPWSWTRQMRLWQDVYEHHYTFPMEKWDDRLGLNTHDDGTMKIAGYVFKDLSLLLNTIVFVDYDPIHHCSRTTSGQLIALLEGDEKQKGNSIYHVNGDQCFASMALSRIQWAGKTLIQASDHHYLYFFSKESDFYHASKLYVKSEGVGEILLFRDQVQSVKLIDCVASTINDIDFQQKEGYTSIQCESEYIDYWLCVEFRNGYDVIPAF